MNSSICWRLYCEITWWHLWGLHLVNHHRHGRYHRSISVSHSFFPLFYLNWALIGSSVITSVLIRTSPVTLTSPSIEDDPMMTPDKPFYSVSFSQLQSLIETNTQFSDQSQMRTRANWPVSRPSSTRSGTRATRTPSQLHSLASSPIASKSTPKW